MYNIKRQREHYLNGVCRRKYHEIDHESQTTARNLIINYIKTWKKPIKISDLLHEIKLKSSLSVPYHKIREIMKNEFNMSYKRVNARPKRDANGTTFAEWCLFSAKFIETISDDHLTINIDECSVGRSCKTNYSWGLKGCNIEWENINTTGSIGLVMAIFSNGCWFWMTTNENINSN